MDLIRHKGFVVGSDNSLKGQNVWKVRVEDSTSSYNGQKLVVASVHGGLELARGLNVNFAIGTVNDKSSQEVLRAVDVCLETLDAQLKPTGQPGQQVRRKGQ